VSQPFDKAPLQIGPHTLANPVVLAPMAGVTDLPMRELALELGAGMAVAEMLTADPSLMNSRKSSLRRRRGAGERLRSVQIVGSEPAQLADAARFNVDEGADIIDINMGCPAKKVCRKAAGSALLADERRVAAILEAVVEAVSVPVTLKIRTGVSPERRNGTEIARIAQESGIQMLAVHGRTRADRFRGHAEYDTIAQIVDTVTIPVLANGDITSAAQAHAVLDHTGAAGVMIGRAAQGRPWLPGLIARELTEHCPAPAPPRQEQLAIIRRHLAALHDFYGELMGVRIARKHVGWFVDALAEDLFLSEPDQARPWRQAFNALETPDQQLDWLEIFAGELAAGDPTPSTLATRQQPAELAA